MHILYLSQVLPYPIDAGPKMRSYFVLRYLAQKHRVTLLTFVRDTDRPEDIAHLAEICYAVHTVPIQRNRLRDVKFLLQSMVTQTPFLIARDHVPQMADKLTDLLRSEKFDAVHADQLWMAQYALAARSHQKIPQLVLDQHNAVHLIPQRMAQGESHIYSRLFKREATLLHRYEPDTCLKFDHVVWVTNEDRQAVEPLYATPANQRPASTVIPICADPQNIEPVQRISQHRRITFLGGLHWPPNAQGILWFARHVFPQIRQAVPDAILTVVGKSPPAGLEGEGIEVTGYVESLHPYLTETAAFIVPLHAGGGMRVKILDAWSWGLPIVSTTIGAEGIHIKNNTDILIADTADAFAAAVIRLLQNPEFARTLGQNGRQTILEKYNWRTVYAAWDTIYR